MFVLLIIFILTVVLLSILVLFDLAYFLRLGFYVVIAKIFCKKARILDETKITGICLTSDIDSLLTHMNNARFIRELDFAKCDFYEKTGLYRTIRKHGGKIVLGATTIRYRRFIKLFKSYVITTKIIHWDEQFIYMEHKFLTSPDSFINAIVLCRTRLTKCNPEHIMNELLDNYSNDIEYASSDTRQKPEISDELSKWIESNEISSNILKNLYKNKTGDN